MSPSILRASFSRFVDLTDEEYTRIESVMPARKYARKEIIHAAGDVAQHLIFIESGLLRYYYVAEGEERNGQFFFEGGWVGDIFSVLTQTPARMFIEAIEPGILRTLHHEELQRLYRKNSKIERFGRLMIENAFVASQSRTASFLSQSPEERYRQLVRTRPKVISRVPQYHIASYLGIKPESLSRIRKRMAEQENGS